MTAHCFNSHSFNLCVVVLRPPFGPFKKQFQGGRGGAEVKNFLGSLALAMSGPPGNYFIIRSLTKTIELTNTKKLMRVRLLFLKNQFNSIRIYIEFNLNCMR